MRANVVFLCTYQAPTKNSRKSYCSTRFKYISINYSCIGSWLFIWRKIMETPPENLLGSFSFRSYAQRSISLTHQVALPLYFWINLSVEWATNSLHNHLEEISPVLYKTTHFFLSPLIISRLIQVCFFLLQRCTTGLACRHRCSLMASPSQPFLLVGDYQTGPLSLSKHH